MVENSSTVLVVSNQSSDSPSSDADEDHDSHREPGEDQRAPQLDNETSQIVNVTNKDEV